MLACRFIIIVIHLGKYIAAFILRLIETNVHLPAHHLNLHLLLLLLLLLIQFDMHRPAAAAYAAAAAAAAAAGRPSARRLLPQQLLSRLAARSLACSVSEASGLLAWAEDDRKGSSGHDDDLSTIFFMID
jgi:hypothetical protein